LCIDMIRWKLMVLVWPYSSTKCNGMDSRARKSRWVARSVKRYDWSKFENKHAILYLYFLICLFYFKSLFAHYFLLLYFIYFYTSFKTQQLFFSPLTTVTGIWTMLSTLGYDWQGKFCLLHSLSSDATNWCSVSSCLKFHDGDQPLEEICTTWLACTTWLVKVKVKRPQ
jgi:hypothetical protein